MIDPKVWDYLRGDKPAEKKELEIFKRIIKKEVNYIDGVAFEKKPLWNYFIKYFLVRYNKEFIRTDETIKNVEPIFKYFLKDETFIESDRVLKTAFGSEISPSLDKGLLIIGSVGNGKTSTMEVFNDVFKNVTVQARECNWKSFKDWDSRRFILESSQDIAEGYSGLKDPADKFNYLKKYYNYRYLFDDIMKEDPTSSYGKKDLFINILDKRYRNNAVTYMTMNYSDTVVLEGYTDIECALIGLSNRYGSHILDRIFAMFNIVEFKGKSKRK